MLVRVITYLDGIDNCAQSVKIRLIICQHSMPILRDGRTTFVTYTQWIASWFFQLFPSFRGIVAKIGEIAGYLDWVSIRLACNQVPCSKREHVWDLILRRTDHRFLRGFEFGVARGYASQWWLDHIKAPSLKWDGFDRFTGLPRSWRNLPEGYFSSDGIPPPIHDDRVMWHIGDVEETLPKVDFQRREDERWIILFDLDLLEPTSFAWNLIKDYLRDGDLLYFDEAFDFDERFVIDQLVLPFGSFDLVGFTPRAIAFQFKGKE